MGAWGLGPYDNDSAADWLGETLEPVVARIAATLEKFEATETPLALVDEVRVAAWLFGRLDRNFVYDGSLRADHRARLAKALAQCETDAYEMGDTMWSTAIQEQMLAFGKDAS
jgi:hypothetical protein